MSTNRLVFQISVFLGAAMLLLATIPPVNLFELDGNAAVDTVGGQDWALLNGNGVGNPPGSPGNSVARAFVPGPSSPSIFTTGGSKDPLDITSWKWTTGSVPDKDKLTNGYAAAYIDSGTGELLLYFGADRYAQNGDSNIGVWFFQDNVAPVAGGTFSGKHFDHDILVVSAFTGGGGTSTITVYEWNSACTGPTFPKNPVDGQCADNNLRVLFNDIAVCGSAEACAVVNNADIPVTWPYVPKSGVSGIVPTGGFYEGGINLTELLAGQGITNLPCFTSFLEETRSSQSTSAVLKDFISHGFPLCGLSIAKQCPTCTIVSSGQAFQYTVNGTVTNAGVGAIYNVVVTDDAGTPSNTSDDLTFNCGNLNPAQTKTWGSTGSDCVATNTFTSATQNPATNTAHASGTTSPGGGTPVTADSTQVTCASCTVNPQLAVGKTCSTTLVLQGGLVAVKVNYSGSVTNNGNEALKNVTVSEDNNADTTVDVASLTLYKGVNPCGSPCTLLPSEVATFSGSYFPSVLTLLGGIPPTGDTAGRAQFSDTVSATGTGVLSNTTPSPQTKTATCTVCPYDACVTSP